LIFNVLFAAVALKFTAKTLVAAEVKLSFCSYPARVSHTLLLKKLLAAAIASCSGYLAPSTTI